MGRPKAWLVVDGVPMAAQVAGTLAAGGCAPVVFVGAAPDPALALGFATVPDEHPGEGPLGGVLTALHAATGDVLVAACDLPRLDVATVRAVLAADPDGRADVVVATVGDRHAPLARWRRSALGAVTEAFAAGVRSWHAALDVVVTHPVAVPLAAATDVDTPADAAALAAPTGEAAGEVAGDAAGDADGAAAGDAGDRPTGGR